MTKNYQTLSGIACLIIGIVGGIAGTAFSMGAERQRVNDILTQHTKTMEALTVDDQRHEEATQKELDRFAQIIATQMTQLQSSIGDLTSIVSGLRIDVQVIKALIERMEKEQDKRNNH
jgi:hypothetical protein